MKNKSKQAIQTARRIYHYDEDEWERTYLSPRGDGFVVTQWERIEESKASKAERLKFEKEMRMCKVLADGRNQGRTEMYFKRARQHREIREKGFESTRLRCVVMEIPKPDKEYFNALAEARRKQAGQMFFFVKDENIVKEVK